MLTELLSLFRSSADKSQLSKSFYDFEARSTTGETISFQRYKDKKVLIVNTASKCGYTPQLEELQKLYEMYNGRIEVLAFPANDFLWQEPGSNKEIENFYCSIYNVTFTIFEKISVKGRKRHPLYAWLAANTGKTPTWNFCKYLVDEKGKVVKFFSNKVSPLDQSIISAI